MHLLTLAPGWLYHLPAVGQARVSCIKGHRWLSGATIADRSSPHLSGARALLASFA